MSEGASVRCHLCRAALKASFFGAYRVLFL